MWPCLGHLKLWVWPGHLKVCGCVFEIGSGCGLNILSCGRVLDILSCGRVLDILRCGRALDILSYGCGCGCG